MNENFVHQVGDQPRLMYLLSDDEISFLFYKHAHKLKLGRVVY